MTIKAYNYLKPNSFRMVIQELPNVSFTCQTVSLPALLFGSANQPTPFIDLPRIGDKLIHDDLVVSFIVQEKMLNYIEIYNWMIGMGFPHDYDEFSAFIDTRDKKFFHKKLDLEPKAYSDINISILDSDNTENINLQYKDCFPISLSRIDLDVKPRDIEYVIASVTFAYSMFKIEGI